MSAAAQSPLRVGLLFDPANPWIARRAPLRGLAERFAGRYAFEERWLPELPEGYDLLFLLGVTRLLPPGALAKNGLALVVHESDLPRGRGFAPVQWQILEGKAEIPLRLIAAAAEADAGDILAEGSMRLAGGELYEEIRDRQAEATFALVAGFLERFPEVAPRRQEGEPTRYARRTPEDSRLDPDKSIREQFNLLRIANNDGWPAFFVLDGRKYLLKIEAAPEGGPQDETP